MNIVGLLMCTHSQRSCSPCNMNPTLQGNLQEVISILCHVHLSLLQAGHGPAVMEVSLLDSNGQVVVDEMSSCGQVKVPLESFKEEQFHVKQSLFGQDQVHGAHAAKAVEGLQLGHTVFPFFKFTYIQISNNESCAWEFLVSRLW